MITVSTDSQPVSDDATELRFQIDDLDYAITALLQQRLKVSTAIQRQRVRSGGTRVDLSRESEILTAYQARLGLDGKDIGLAVLTYCRGDVNASDNERQG